ncbi:MAG: SDR family oxidoreductase [Pseudomonadota bacterium]
MNTLLCLGFGYVAEHLTRSLDPAEWRVLGTTRSEEKFAQLQSAGAEPILWPGGDLTEALAEATHIVSSVPPRNGVDPVLDCLREATVSPDLTWLALLSTTGVYGDQDGAWVDETAPVVPASHRGGLRAEQEKGWLALSEAQGWPVHIFRLAGIYGPGRSAFDKLRDGTARRIVKPGQIFSRTHVTDIVAILKASIAQPRTGGIYNVADDGPCPPQDVIAFAAGLLGVPVPPDIPFETADLSPMARSFYADNKKVSNARVKSELGVEFTYPTYRDGLAAILAQET